MSILLERPPTSEVGTGWIPPVFVVVLGTAMAGFGAAMLGNLTWIKSDGLLAGGAALIALAPFARTMLDPVMVSTPFMYYTLSPVGGLLTVGTSDVILPVIVGVLALSAVVRAGRGSQHGVPPSERLPAAPGLLVLGLLVMSGTTVWWQMVDPDFMLARAVADGLKLSIGVAYLWVVVVLVRRYGWEGAIRAARIWAAVATGLAVLTVVGMTGAVSIVPSDGHRSLGYFEDANLYAGYLLVSLSLVLFVGILRPSPWQLAQSVLLLGALVATGSRGGLVSLSLLVLFVIVIVNSLRVRLAVLGLGALGVVVLHWVVGAREGGGAALLGVDRLAAASDQVDSTRFELWSVAIEQWLASPLWGIGLGQFERHSAEVRRLETGLGLVTHNSFLFFLVSFGVLGLALFLYLFWWLLRSIYTATALPRPARHALASGLLVIASQMMTLNLQNLRYVWAYFGLVLGIALLARTRPEEIR